MISMSTTTHKMRTLCVSSEQAGQVLGSTKVQSHFHFIKQNLWLFDIKTEREKHTFSETKYQFKSRLSRPEKKIPRNSFECFSISIPLHRNHCWAFPQRFMFVRKFSFRAKCLTASSHDHKKFDFDVAEIWKISLSIGKEFSILKIFKWSCCLGTLDAAACPREKSFN